MAGEVVDCGEEFWLPSEFLADDFFLEEKNYYCKSKSGGGVSVEGESGGFGSEFPCDGSESNPSSPGDSVNESDEEDYIAGLTRRMAHSFLYDSDDKASENQRLQAVGLACSPQSPLCAAGAWAALSSRDSLKGPSQVSSPPSPLEPLKDNNNTGHLNSNWDLLYAAAGQVVRMRLNEEAKQQQKLHGTGLLGPPRKVSSSPSYPVPPKSATSIGGYYANPPLTLHQLQINQFQQLKQQQLLKQHYAAAWGRQHLQQQSRALQPRCRPVPASSTAWPSLQPQQPPPPLVPHGGSGMRAIFLGAGASRKQSGGTGVFLPRRVGSPNASRKKPACSTVLVPEKVVQALNLNLEDMGAQTRLPGVAFIPDHDAIAARNNSLLSQKRSHALRPHHQPAAAISPEIRLPPEWTY